MGVNAEQPTINVYLDWQFFQNKADVWDLTTQFTKRLGALRPYRAEID
ncbi:hypothetical protein RintRC_4228 [Richelia intracellularis]|nr:hypothetical protein RintRC_4228 [Richelia intracellularis]